MERKEEKEGKRGIGGGEGNGDENASNSEST